MVVAQSARTLCAQYVIHQGRKKGGTADGETDMTIDLLNGERIRPSSTLV